MDPHHNQPPLIDRLAVDHEPLISTAKSWIEAAERLPLDIALEDTISLGKVADYVRGVRGMVGRLDDARKAEKDVFDKQAAAVQGFFTPWAARLVRAKATAEAIIGQYNNRKDAHERQLRAEAAASLREEATRQADAAASLESRGHGAVGEAVLDHAQETERMAGKLDAQAVGRSADLVRTQAGDGVVSSRGDYDFTIDDRAAMGLGRLTDHFTQAALEAAIRSFKAAEKMAGRAPTLPGVTFTWANRAVIR